MEKIIRHRTTNLIRRIGVYRPIILRGGLYDGAEQGEEFAFNGPEEHPDTIRMPSVLTAPYTWRTPVYRLTGDGVNGCEACVFYDFDRYD